MEYGQRAEYYASEQAVAVVAIMRVALENLPLFFLGKHNPNVISFPLRYWTTK